MRFGIRDKHNKSSEEANTAGDMIDNCALDRHVTAAASKDNALDFGTTVAGTVVGTLLSSGVFVRGG